MGIFRTHNFVVPRDFRRQLNRPPCTAPGDIETKDQSRNNLWLALLTLGEGWHNNHHFYPASARQGFRKREIDLTFYFLRFLSLFRLVSELKTVPAWVHEKANK